MKPRYGKAWWHPEHDILDVDGSREHYMHLIEEGIADPIDFDAIADAAAESDDPDEYEGEAVAEATDAIMKRAFEDAWVRILLEDDALNVQGQTDKQPVSLIKKIAAYYGLPDDYTLRIDDADFNTLSGDGYQGTIGDYIKPKNNMSQIARMLKDIRFQ